MFNYPYWPAIILHPSWLSPEHSAKLKLSKKKLQNRMVAQFIDEANSS